jgi:hypothetical protein
VVALQEVSLLSSAQKLPCWWFSLSLEAVAWSVASRVGLEEQVLIWQRTSRRISLLQWTLADEQSNEDHRLEIESASTLC